MESTERGVQFLRRCDLFSGMGTEGLHAVAEVGRLVGVDRRRRLYEQGSRAEKLFVVGSGRARILRRGPDDRELTLDYRGPGEIAGECGLVDGTYHSEGVATERIEALSLPMPEVDRLLAREPSFAKALVRAMGERRLAMERRMEALLTRTVESRVAEFLCDAAARYGVPDSRGFLIGVKFTHQEIASFVGSTRETVTLVLGDLKRRGLILIDHRRVIVKDPDNLRELI